MDTTYDKHDPFCGAPGGPMKCPHCKALMTRGGRFEYQHFHNCPGREAERNAETAAFFDDLTK